MASIFEIESSQQADSEKGSSALPSEDVLQEYRKRVEGTNIDARSFLSTDYFNSFNSVVMILDLLPDAPDLLEEVEQWRYVNYTEHFKASGLDFAELAIEVYPFSPPELREAFERKVQGIRLIIESLIKTLRGLLDAGEKDAFANLARTTTAQLRAMMGEGNGLVHGYACKAQEEIDKMFQD
ncbi:MAG: hypothetical protein PHS57_03630 [Alphaproteobacteria bacterium]|nr:hypothetical protein [Alphaproteobacteria bacterium]